MPSFARNTINMTVNDAVFHALSQHLAQEQAGLALDIWAEKYHDRHLARVVGFLNDIAATIELDRQILQKLRIDLYRSLCAVSDDVKQSAPDTAQRQAPPSKSKQDVSYRILEEKNSKTTPDVAVFTRLCESIIEGAQKTGYQEFSEFNLALRDLVAQAGLPTLVEQNLLDWSSHQAPLLKAALPKEQLAKIVHIFYVALCESAGPVAGDAILSAAVNKVQQMPEARLFPVRSLL